MDIRTPLTHEIYTGVLASTVKFLERTGPRSQKLAEFISENQSNQEVAHKLRCSNVVASRRIWHLLNKANIPTFEPRIRRLFIRAAVRHLAQKPEVGIFEQMLAIEKESLLGTNSIDKRFARVTTKKQPTNGQASERVSTKPQKPTPPASNGTAKFTNGHSFRSPELEAPRAPLRLPYRGPTSENPKLDPATKDQILATMPSLKAFAISLCGNVDRAEDLVQETMLRALAHIHSFQPGTNMPAWLFTILRNLFRSEYRKRRREVEDVDGRYAETLKSQPEQSGRVEFAEFRAALGKLPSDQREALILVSASGFSYDDAAAICGCAVGTIKSRVHRARERLLERLQIDCVDDFGPGPPNARDPRRRGLKPISTVMNSWPRLHCAGVIFFALKQGYFEIMKTPHEFFIYKKYTKA